MDYSVLIVAAGKKAAEGASYAKALASFNDSKSVLGQTISVFMHDAQCKQVVIVASSADMTRVVKSNGSGKIVYVKGGKTRQESVLIGLTAVSEDVVLIHDGVRPWLRQGLIDKLLVRMQTEKACVLGLPPTSRMCRIVDGYIESTVDTDSFIQTQTPQAYHTSFILSCYAKANRSGGTFMDDSEVVSAFSDVKIAVEAGDSRNRRFILKKED